MYEAGNDYTNLFVQGLRDSVREADPYYISARGDEENYIVENVERVDIWTSYYAGRCGGDMINEQVAYLKAGALVLSAYYTGGAIGGALEGFFGGSTMWGALANGGGMLIPGTAVAAGSEAGAVVIGTLGGINLVDVWLRRTEASQGMGEAIRKGRQKAEVEKGKNTSNKPYKNNKEANDQAQQHGYKNAHELKEDYVGKSNVSKFDMKYDTKTGEIYLESKDGKIQVPTGLMHKP